MGNLNIGSEQNCIGRTVKQSARIENSYFNKLGMWIIDYERTWHVNYTLILLLSCAARASRAQLRSTCSEVRVTKPDLTFGGEAIRSMGAHVRFVCP